MTRYTKLEGRKKEFLPSSNHFGDRADSETQEDRLSTSLPPAAGPALGEEQIPPADPSFSDPNGADEKSSVPEDVTKLMKRSKLLKLKAKKAKTPEKRKAFSKEIRQLGRQIAEIGPIPSHGTKRKRDDGDRKGDKRMYTQEERTAYRRQKRAEERQASMRCFACRGQGHTAKDCPNTLNASSTALESETRQEENGAGLTGSSVVGICFRCGSKDHTLAQCTLPGGGKGAARGGKNLPFATCFVCGEKGHLSLACPKNRSRGVYPNGGSCKLCQSVEHLVRDCPLREQQAVSDPKLGAAIADQPTQVGADEDDFHAFSRVRNEVDSDEAKVQQQAKDLARRRASTPVVKKPVTKKVVTF